MRILLTGAGGFIGSHVMGALLEAGHDVRGAVRRPKELMTRFPTAEAVALDFNQATNVDDWTGPLRDVDAVVNCAGVLRGNRRQRIEDVHLNAPKALFTACERLGVKRLIHISAVSADAGAHTTYAHTKAEAEAALQATALDWVILRPSLVYAAGSYGGTSLLRGLAALPWVLPVVGDGSQPFRPIHARDFAMGIVRLVERPEVAQVTLEPAGPEIVTLAGLLTRLRAWLGLRPARMIRVPAAMARLTAQIGDLVRAATFNTTAFRQLQYGNTGDPAEFIRLTGVSPAPMKSWLWRQPSHVQDRWHARLYWLRGLLRYVLGGLWLASGAIGLGPARGYVLGMLAFSGLSGAGAWAIVAGTCGLDIALGILVLFRWRPRLLGPVQLLVVVGYTVALSVVAPGLWADPFGVLVKNVPILVAIGIWTVLEDDR